MNYGHQSKEGRGRDRRVLIMISGIGHRHGTSRQLMNAVSNVEDRYT